MPFADLKDTAVSWLPRMRRSAFFIYWLVITLIAAGFCALFLIHVDISVRAPGIIRPLNERTDIRSTVTGFIDSLYHKEGDPVQKNSILVTIRDPALIGKKNLNETEMRLREDFIHDLDLLTARIPVSEKIIPLLISPLYRQQAMHFFARTNEEQLNILKATHETRMNTALAKDRVISPKEFYDIRMQQQKTIAALESSQREWFASWQADLVKYKSEWKELVARQEELRQLYNTYCIRAPVAGFLQELNGRYAAGSIQAGEIICSLSPGGEMLAECYVSTRDIGMLKPGQTARFMIDAFDYNYFGVVTGQISSIDNDFILLDKSPVFKVRCRLNQEQLSLKNGYHGKLKKGMHFQARFAVKNRTLWQLLYDTADDWLNPAL